MPRRLLALRLGVLSLLAGVVAGGLTTPAAAHPHIWIEAKASLQMDKRRIVAVTQEWTFDAFFSAALIKDFDKNGDGRFSADEIGEMRKNAFAALKDFGIEDLAVPRCSRVNVVIVQRFDGVADA